MTTNRYQCHLCGHWFEVNAETSANQSQSCPNCLDMISNMALARVAAVKQNISPYPMAATPFNAPSVAALTHPRPIKLHRQ